MSAVSNKELAAALASDSREDAVRALGQVVVGMLERRIGSRAEAIEALPAAVKAVLSARRRLKGGALRAGILGILKEKAPGSPADGVRAGLGHTPDGTVVAKGALAENADGNADGLEELLLVTVEGLSFREAGSLTGAPAAMVERQASLAFARIAETLASS